MANKYNNTAINRDAGYRSSVIVLRKQFVKPPSNTKIAKMLFLVLLGRLTKVSFNHCHGYGTLSFCMV